MIGMHYSTRNNLQPKSVLDVVHFGSPVSSETTSPLEENCNTLSPNLKGPHPPLPWSYKEELNRGMCLGRPENCKKEGSFLSTRHSPPSTSTSTLSENNTHQGSGSVNEWVAELQPFAAGVDLGAQKFNLGFDEWESFLSQSVGNNNKVEGNVGFESIQQSSGIQNSLGSDSSDNGNQQSMVLDASVNNLASFPPGLGLQQQMQLQFGNLEQKPESCNHYVMVNQLPNVQCAPYVNFLYPLLRGSQPDHPPAKRHNPRILDPIVGSQIPKIPLADPCHELLLRKHKELPPMQHLFGFGQHLNSISACSLPEKGLTVCNQEVAGGGRNQMSSVQQQDQQQQVLYGQLFKAMELILTRNFTQAQGILARLNHQLSPSMKPFQRSSFYFKEALQHVLLMSNVATSLPLRIPNPFDCMLKMSAYKAFSEASPLIQFMNFTSNQAILEAVDDADCIHIIDFDIGFGAQWSSFIQELPRRKRGPPSSLKLTAFSSPSTHHSIEIGLMHGSLTQFAIDVGINFELEVVNFDSFDPNLYPVSTLRSSDNEAIAVNLPIWSIESHLSLLPSLLCLIKQMSPEIVVSMERGCERFELPFPYHLLHTLQYFEVLMDSLDAAKMDPDSTNKIERCLLQPKIESLVLGRLQSADVMPSWRNVFASACFSQVGFSNFAELQAECVAKRTHIRGFNVEKRHTSLVLCWQHHELLTASAWRCS